jgi:hypothetical protein
MRSRAIRRLGVLGLTLIGALALTTGSMAAASAADTKSPSALTQTGTPFSSVAVGSLRTNTPDAGGTTCGGSANITAQPSGDEVWDIWVHGNTTCTGDVPVTVCGQVHLIQGADSIEDGNEFCGAMGGDSYGFRDLNPPGMYAARYDEERMLPSGWVWAGSDPRCQGYETSIITCETQTNWITLQ